MLLPLHLNLPPLPDLSGDWREEPKSRGKSKKKRIRLVRKLFKEYKQVKNKSLVVEDNKEFLEIDLYGKLLYESLLSEFDKELLNYKEALKIEKAILEAQSKMKAEEANMMEIDLAYIIMILASACDE